MVGQPKILILSGVRGDTRRYRTLHLYEQLRLAGVNCALSHLTDPKLPELARSASIAVMHRVAYDRHLGRIISILQARNAHIILDADDFLYDPSVMTFIDSPDFADPVRFALYRKEILRHKKTLEHCDGITVSTDYLAKLMQPFGKITNLHRNAYNLEMLELSEKAFRARAPRSEPVVIGYASGTRTHDKDFALVRPAIQRIMSRYPQVELWLMGPIAPGEGWEGLQDRIRAFPLVPWRMLPERLAMLDINLAPLLPDSPFNQAKSEIKFMEAALVRVPTVASKTDAFASAVHHAQTGLLIENEAEWEQAIEALVVNDVERKEMGEKAYQFVLDQYSPQQRGKEYVDILVSQLEKTGRDTMWLRNSQTDRSKPQGPVLSPDMEMKPSYFDLALYSFKNRGPTTLLGQVWVFIRRLLAPVFPFRKA